MNNVTVENVSLNELLTLIEQIVEKKLQSHEPNEQHHSDENYLTPKQAAKKLGICTHTLRVWRVRDFIKGYRIGTKWRYRLDDIDKTSQVANKIKYRKSA